MQNVLHRCRKAPQQELTDPPTLLSPTTDVLYPLHQVDLYIDGEKLVLSMMVNSVEQIEAMRKIIVFNDAMGFILF